METRIYATPAVKWLINDTLTHSERESTVTYFIKSVGIQMKRKELTKTFMMILN